MEVLYPRCAGLDVHSRRVNGCVRVASGRTVTTEHREFATTTAGLLELAAWLTEAGCTHVAMEATGVYWKPVWYILEESFTLVLANAQHVRNVPGRKSDRSDAAWIADLLAHGLIRGSFVPPTPIQELRDLTRTRKQLVGEIARHTLRLQKALEDANVKLAHVVTVNRTGFSGGSISWEDGVHGKTEQILTRGSRASGPDGIRARRPARLAVGGDPVRRREDRVFIGNAPTLGAASGTGSGPSPGVDDRRAGAVESTGA